MIGNNEREIVARKARAVAEGVMNSALKRDESDLSEELDSETIRLSSGLMEQGSKMTWSKE